MQKEGKERDDISLGKHAQVDKFRVQRVRNQKYKKKPQNRMQKCRWKTPKNERKKKKKTSYSDF
jgi:hypothetical protein